MEEVVSEENQSQSEIRIKEGALRSMETLQTDQMILRKGLAEIEHTEEVNAEEETKIDRSKCAGTVVPLLTSRENVQSPKRTEARRDSETDQTVQIEERRDKDTTMVAAVFHPSEW